MGRKRPYYTPEFRSEAVSLFRRSDKPVGKLATDIGISEPTLRRWAKQADIDEGKGPEGALTTEERKEIRKLRRQVKQLTEERDFLKKVSSFFARENS